MFEQHITTKKTRNFSMYKKNVHTEKRMLANNSSFFLKKVFDYSFYFVYNAKLPALT